MTPLGPNYLPSYAAGVRAGIQEWPNIPKSIYNRGEIGFSLPGPTNACRLVSPAKNFEPVTTNRFWKVKEKVDHIKVHNLFYKFN